MSTADEHLAWLETAADGGPDGDALTRRLFDVAMAYARQARTEGNTNHQMFHQLVAGQMLATARLARVDEQLAGLREDIRVLSARIAALEDVCPGLDEKGGGGK